ncbi:MAG: hypothetical protein ACRDGI_05150 [Candidatus Limnocylindrales bacterium]
MSIRLANLGFLACPRPVGDEPAYLLVALRSAPSLRHFDPTSIEYWISAYGRGSHRVLTRQSLLPVDTQFSWGPIRITDRLGMSNDYVAFGGHLRVEDLDGEVTAVFTSPVPILKAGGHSQDFDLAACSVGAFFGRFLLAADYVLGFEARVAAAEPAMRYAAFISAETERFAGSPVLRAQESDLWVLLGTERLRLRADQPDVWNGGCVLAREVSRVASEPAGRSSSAIGSSALRSLVS